MKMTIQVPIRKSSADGFADTHDWLAVEEPLEIRVEYGPEAARQLKNLSVTMRTPGADADLVAGFLFTEGLIGQPADLLEVHLSPFNDSVALARLHPDCTFDLQKLERHFYTTSSCGVCGKSSIDAVRATVTHSLSNTKLHVAPEVLYELPNTLRRAQAAFDQTGGLHAAALFAPDGHLLALREDVGRHNALDKLLGSYLLAGALPPRESVLLLSGRASFELLQKAAVAGLPMVCAVGAPSSLAVETARSFGITLVGFLRDGRANWYCD